MKLYVLKPSVVKELDKAHGKCKLKKYTVIGYAHSVEFRQEKPLITAILQKDRLIEIKT